MSDILISHYRDDWTKAVKLATVFVKEQWTFSLDPQKESPDDSTLQLRGQERGRAKVAVILWSRAASASPSMREALTRMGQILPVFVLLEKVEPPLEFMAVRAFDLSDWDGAESHTGLQKLLRHVRALIATSSLQDEPRTFPAGAPRFDLLGNELRIQKKHDDPPAKAEERFKGVFISYRRDEAAAYARGLYDRLAARFGRERVFLDVENIGWGEDFVEAITSAAESCAVMIVLVSRKWARGPGERAGADDYVRLEVATALGRGIRVVPILIQGAAMPAAKELSEDLAPLLRRNALALSDTRWERDVEDLIKSLENLL